MPKLCGGFGEYSAKFFSMLNKAIFLDRDGVINNTVFKMGKPRAPYTHDEFSYCSGVSEAIGILKNAGFILVVVTNQPDVARGWVSQESVAMINQMVCRDLPLDELLACFHTEKDNCNCRKPRPGMLLAARDKFNIDMSQSVMVGDRVSDVEAGIAAGCRTVLIGSNDLQKTPKANFVADSLLDWVKDFIKD